eukprot:Clim_evm50s243 gene=Clim_evmTU50s243
MGEGDHPREIPGFIYDPRTKKYFAVPRGGAGRLAHAGDAKVLNQVLDRAPSGYQQQIGRVKQGRKRRQRKEKHSNVQIRTKYCNIDKGAPKSLVQEAFQALERRRHILFPSARSRADRLAGRLDVYSAVFREMGAGRQCRFNQSLTQTLFMSHSKYCIGQCSPHRCRTGRLISHRWSYNSGFNGRPGIAQRIHITQDSGAGIKCKTAIAYGYKGQITATDLVRLPGSTSTEPRATMLCKTPSGLQPIEDYYYGLRSLRCISWSPKGHFVTAVTGTPGNAQESWRVHGFGFRRRAPNALITALKVGYDDVTDHFVDDRLSQTSIAAAWIYLATTRGLLQVPIGADDSSYFRVIRTMKSCSVVKPFQVDNPHLLLFGSKKNLGIVDIRDPGVPRAATRSQFEVSSMCNLGQFPESRRNPCEIIHSDRGGNVALWDVRHMKGPKLQYSVDRSDGSIDRKVAMDALEENFAICGADQRTRIWALDKQYPIMTSEIVKLDGGAPIQAAWAYAPTTPCDFDSRPFEEAACYGRRQPLRDDHGSPGTGTVCVFNKDMLYTELQYPRSI